MDRETLYLLIRHLKGIVKALEKLLEKKNET
jgi:hypothetical protein